MLLMHGCSDVADAQEREIAPLGRHTVGSKLSEVRSLQRSENCLIEGGNADCTFTDANGVAYVVLDASVIAVKVVETTASSTVTLPFGLVFGDSIGTAVQKLVSSGRTWLVGKDPGVQTGVAVSSTARYPGKNGWDFNVEVHFDSGRLVGVTYNSGTI